MAALGAGETDICTPAPGGVKPTLLEKFPFTLILAEYCAGQTHIYVMIHNGSKVAVTT